MLKQLHPNRYSSLFASTPTITLALRPSWLHKKTDTSTKGPATSAPEMSNVTTAFGHPRDTCFPGHLNFPARKFVPGASGRQPALRPSSCSACTSICNVRLWSRPVHMYSPMRDCANGKTWSPTTGERDTQNGQGQGCERADQYGGRDTSPHGRPHLHRTRGGGARCLVGTRVLIPMRAQSSGQVSTHRRSTSPAPFRSPECLTSFWSLSSRCGIT